MIRHIPGHAFAFRVLGLQVCYKMPLPLLPDLFDPEPGVGYGVNVSVSDFHFFPS